MQHLDKYIEIVTADYSDFDGYTERHHIIPKSWWSNDYIVTLPAAQHLLAHYHLHMAFPEDAGMTYALHMMCSMKSYKQRDFSIIEEFAEIYAEAKKAFSAARMGKKASAKTKAKMSASRMGMKFSAKTKAKMSANHADVSGDKNPRYGKKHSAEARAKISAKKTKYPQKVWWVHKSGAERFDTCKGMGKAYTSHKQSSNFVKIFTGKCNSTNGWSLKCS